MRDDDDQNQQTEQLRVRRFDPTRIAAPNGATMFALPDEFPLSTPVDLEIGCGVGWHPIRHAAENPERFLIAIEHTRAKFERFRSRLDRHPSLTNLKPVHADAIRWLTHCLGAESIDRCFILYPNPEPKAPSRRWFRMPFMQRLLETLKPGGTIQLTTNERAYRDEALDFAVNFWGLKVLSSRSLTTSTLAPGLPRTHFEKKYLERGETCFDITFVKP